MGSAACLGFLSCPTVISYLSSMPTSKKKMAMRKSLTKASMVIEKVAGPMPSERGAWSTSSITS